jgi:hypothetical protein
MMSDREHSPAYAALPFAAIERAIGDGSSASVSYADFGLDYHISRGSISSSLKLLDHLRLIEIEPGRRLVNVFWLSRRWCTIDEVEAKRRAELARERRFQRAVHPKPVKRSKLKPVIVARPRMRQRRVPSLPTMPWQDDGR